LQRGKGLHGEQFIRYRDGLPNWILTDYLQFRWFVNGEKRLTVCVAELDAKGKLKLLPDGEEKLGQLLTAFIKQEALTIGTARDLAKRMAGMTHIIRDLINNTFDHEKEKGLLHNWLAAFRETLIPDLNEKQFADMFAQTLTYGLFAAWMHTPLNKVFSREMAAYNLPKTNPFLRKLFAEIAGVDMPDSIAWAVDDIVELLKHADMSGILKDFGKGRGKDPVVHFYETFLSAYDPKMRELRGVYYTPEPVVSYIVRSIDHLLKTRFNRPKGLADENTLILDPATGTATFLYFVIEQIRQKFSKQAGAWDDYVAKHLLNRIFGFELLMAPYAVAHLKIGMQLQETGYKFESDQRLGIYLTNTLEEAAKKSEQLFASWVADEANAAAKIKRDDPILVVLGNPPYSYESANRGEWISALVRDYYQVDGQRLDERNPRGLQDDYVKFIRFAEWRIAKTGEGIIGFISNHSYLDNPTFRGMRQHLMQSFNEIYVYDLHGNTKKKEQCPDGSEDKNVFDIQQGVAILLCVKEKGNNTTARLFHADLWGLREAKYSLLLEASVTETEWVELKPTSPFYFFVPRATEFLLEYEQGWKVTEIMPVNSVGIVTSRDHLAVYFSREEAKQALTEFVHLPVEEARAKFKLGEDSQEWRVELAQADLQQTKLSDDNFVNLYYRPFDVRFTYYTGTSGGFLGRPRPEVMRHMLAPNLALLTSRMTKGEDFAHAQVTRFPSEKIAMSPKTSNNSFHFPLYVHGFEKKKKGDWGKAITMVLFESPAGYQKRRPNLSPAFLKALAEKLKLPQEKPHGLPEGITPEDIFHYAYAVFHSPNYRKRYAEFLKIDFPRLPLTSDMKLFRALATKGADLVALHLMESPKLEEFITDWPVKGDNLVEKVQYTEKNKRVWINKTQYFEGVPKDVWEFHIGGYQVCDKWLKDRKGRALSYDDIMHYQKIIVALKETLHLMTEIDECIPHWPLA